MCLTVGCLAERRHVVWPHTSMSAHSRRSMLYSTLLTACFTYGGIDLAFLLDDDDPIDGHYDVIPHLG